MKPMVRFSALLAALSSLCGPCQAAVAVASHYTSTSTQVRLVSIYPHNTSAFTEGFFFLDGTIVESTGLERQSFIRQYKLANPAELHGVVTVRADDGDDDDDDSNDGNDTDDDGATGATAAPAGTTRTGETRFLLTHRPMAQADATHVLREFQFDPEIFGEGIACIDDKIYALTYKHNKILVLSKYDLKLLATHPFHTVTGEGWGMTTNGSHLIVSDGSATIQFYDPQNFKRVFSIDVTSPSTGEKVNQLNELEFVDGEILANVWFKNVILRIDPDDGRVIEELDLDWVPAMVPNVVAMSDIHMRGEAVMNGIAFNPKNRHVYITGKLWDSIFELELSYLSDRRGVASKLNT
jgi:glutaminyl-peptide cyclotransferase